MKINNRSAVWLTAVFLIIYSIFVLRMNYSVENYSDIIVATTFFFTLFTGFFITRQNDRYSDITEIIAERDANFSFLYRVFGMVPRVQAEIRAAIHDHYDQILKHDDWAYNEFHASNTLTRITRSMSSITDEESDKIKNNPPFDGIWGAIQELQESRKKIIASYEERLAGFQWAIVYLLSLLLIVSFDLVPTKSILIEILKILFGTAVFISIMLLKQLDNLTLFDDHAGHKSAEDIFRIINEKDSQELSS